MFASLNLSGQVVDSRFELRMLIREGSWSSVYAASDRAADNADIAVKILNVENPNPVDHEVFRHWIRRRRRLSHPNIIDLIDGGWSDGLGAFYLASDYRPYSLENHLLGEVEPASLDHDQIMCSLAGALAYAHAQGMSHENIRPSNVLMDADGYPYLADFGFRKLIRDLAAGSSTVPVLDGYASPEVRAGRPVSFESDIYSLGALFFFLLSGEPPPDDGLRPPMVDNYISERSEIRSILKGMLADCPRERAAIGRALFATLQGISQGSKTLPRYILAITDSARRSLRDMGRIASDDFDAAAKAISYDLGTDSHSSVYVQQDPWSEDTIFVIGDSLRLVCKPDGERQALVVVAVHSYYTPERDEIEGRAILHRGIWIPMRNRSTTYRGNDNRELLSMLKAHKQAETPTSHDVPAFRIAQSHSRFEYIKHWHAVLQHYAQEVLQGGRPYASLGFLDSGLVRFNLDELPPDDQEWPPNAALAVAPETAFNGLNTRTMRNHFEPVGNLIWVDGQQVVVDPTEAEDLNAIPSSGRLILNPIGHLTAIERQRRAVESFLMGKMANPRLADIILEPSNATRQHDANVDFFQDWLSEDKQDVVRKALASNDLFLIQGPPGTGKTTVIAEIILQLLKKNSRQRILMTSQSNIAVDHALIQVARANVGNSTQLEMLRLGNAQDIDGRAPTLVEKAETLRSTILERCDATISDLAHIVDSMAKRPDDHSPHLAFDTGSAIQVSALLEDSDNCLEAIAYYEPLAREASEWAALVEEELASIRAYKQDHLRSLIALVSLKTDYHADSESNVRDVIHEAELAVARQRIVVALDQMMNIRRRKQIGTVIKRLVQRVFGRENQTDRLAEKAGSARRQACDTVLFWITETNELIAHERDYHSYSTEMLQRQDILSTAVSHAKRQRNDDIDSVASLLNIDSSQHPHHQIVDQLKKEARLQTIYLLCLQVKKRTALVSEVISDWRLVAGRTTDFEKLIVEQSNVVGATCVYVGNQQLRDTKFDWAIIDEAGRATAPEALIPIVKANGIILVGDQRQLPPTIDELTNKISSDISNEFELDQSLFQAMLAQVESANDGHSADLRTQYRMHPAIGELISGVFYDGRLEQGTTAESRQECFWLPRPVTWLTTSNLRGKAETPRGTSFANSVEADLVWWQLREFERRGREQGINPTVGVISGYAAQLEEIRRRVVPRDGNRWQSLQIEIATVDAFQGRERDIVIYSIVRSNRQGRIGFLRDYRRINVALSRARQLLVIVGDHLMMSGPSLGGQANPFSSVLNYINAHPDDCIVQIAREAEHQS